MVEARAEVRRTVRLAARAGAGRIGARGAGLLLACALAVAATAALVGTQVVLHPGRGVVGSNPSADFQIMAWSLVWWPWAIAHGVNPLHTSLLWPPHGFSTLWMTTIPVPALLGLPFTLAAGPLASYNLLMVAAIVLAAAGAYLLCFELTDKVAPSLLGAGVFALSPYMLGHTVSQHLDLTFVFPLPALALLVVRHLRGKTSARRFVLGSAALVLVLAGSSLELLVDLVLVLTLVALLALVVEREHRRTVLRVASLLGLAGAACLPVLVPMAVVALAQPHGSVPHSASSYAVDLLNPLVPTATLSAGRLGVARSLASHFVGNIGERDGYVGVPLLLVSLLALRANRRRGARVAGLLVAVALVLSLGPTPTFGGHPLLTLPFSIWRLPILGDALPARLSVFASLGLAVLSALWLAQPGRRPVRLAVAAVLAGSLLPAFSGPQRVASAWPVSNVLAWSVSHPPAGFVDAPGWRRVVPPGSTVLVVPTRDRSAAGYWQASTNMGFRLAIPETPFVPPSLAADPTVVGLVDGNLPVVDGVQLAAARLRAYLRADRVAAVAATPSASPRWLAVVRRAVPTRPLRLPGALVFRVPHRLPPLRASGELAAAGALRTLSGLGERGRRAVLEASLRYDGRRAHLRVLLAGGRGPAREATLSAAGADAEEPAVALGAHGIAAVAFVEWNGHEERLRVATEASSRWRLVTLATSALPIWSPQVAVTTDGAAVAVWSEVRGANRILAAAVFEPHRGWRPPVVLDDGDGIADITLRAADTVVVAAWHDSLASENRVRAATYAGGRWHGALLATSLRALGGIAIDPAGARSVTWRTVRLDRRPLVSRADRHGTSWSEAG